MSLQQWIGLGVGRLLLAFLWFTFNQGMKVKPREGSPEEPPAEAARECS
jgi:hypothetical protein